MQDASIINLIIPKQLAFVHQSPVSQLKIENKSPYTIVYKIKSNNKTALSISYTHDFIPGLALKQIPVRLLETLENIKLEINYAKADPQMIAKNDSKMSDIDKKNIKKAVIKIVTPIGMPPIHSSKTQSEAMMSSIKSQTNFQSKSASNQIVVQKNVVQSAIMSPNLPKQELQNKEKDNFFKSQMVPRKGALQTVEQHEDEDLEQLQEKRKNIENEIKQLTKEIASVNQILTIQKQQTVKNMHEQSIMKPYAIFLILVASFILGNLIRALLIS